jgi:hypothetical protein
MKYSSTFSRKNLGQDQAAVSAVEWPTALEICQMMHYSSLPCEVTGSLDISTIFYWHFLR